MDDDMKWKLMVGGTVGGACAVFTACLVFAILVCRRRMKQRKRVHELARQPQQTMHPWSRDQQATPPQSRDQQITPPWSRDQQATPPWIHNTSLGEPPLGGGELWEEPARARIDLIDSRRERHEVMTSPPCVHRDVSWVQGLSGDTTPRPASSVEYSPGRQFQTSSSTTTYPSIPSSDTVDRSSSSNTWWLHQAVTSRGHDVTAGSTISRTNLEEFFLSLEDDRRDSPPPGTPLLNQKHRNLQNHPPNNLQPIYRQPNNFYPPNNHLANNHQLNNHQPNIHLSNNFQLNESSRSRPQPSQNIQHAIRSLRPPETKRSRKTQTASTPGEPGTPHSHRPDIYDWSVLPTNRIRAPRNEYISDSVDFGYVSDRSRVHRPSDIDPIPSSWIAERSEGPNSTDESQTSLGLVELEPFGEIGKRSQMGNGYKLKPSGAVERKQKLEPCRESSGLSGPGNGFQFGIVAERKPHWEEEPDEIWLPRNSQVGTKQSVNAMRANKKGQK